MRASYIVAGQKAGVWEVGSSGHAPGGAKDLALLCGGEGLERDLD